jgi:hypothetical protein
MRGDGGGGCGILANEYSCAHHVTWSPINFGDLPMVLFFELLHLWRPWMKEARDKTWRGGGLPTLPGLNLSTIQPSQ